MENVYVVRHSYEDACECEQIKFIGVYATEQDAEAAVARKKACCGFSKYPDGFSVVRIPVGKDLWSEGFLTE